MRLKYTLRLFFSLLFLLSFSLQAQNAFAGAKITIKTLLSKPNKYDRKEVTIKGKATTIEPRTSKRGNDYTTFILKDTSGRAVNIYTRGHPLITEGQRVTVTGIYQKVQMFGRYAIHNEVKAWNIVR